MPVKRRSSNSFQRLTVVDLRGSFSQIAASFASLTMGMLLERPSIVGNKMSGSGSSLRLLLPLPTLTY